MFYLFLKVLIFVQVIYKALFYLFMFFFMMWLLILYFYKHKNIMYIMYMFFMLFMLLWALYFLNIDNLMMMELSDLSKMLFFDVTFWENLCDMLNIKYSLFNIYMLTYMFIFTLYLFFFIIKIMLNKFNLYLMDKENKYLPFFSFFFIFIKFFFLFLFYFGVLFKFSMSRFLYGF